MSNNLKFGATMILELVRDNKIIETRKVHNTIVNSGYDLVADLLGNTTRPDRIGYIAVGTGSSATTGSMTALGTPWGSRISATYTHTAGTALLTLAGTVAAHTGATVALREAGLFNASTSGTMFDRVTFDAINKAATDTVNIRFVINLSEGT